MDTLDLCSDPRCLASTVDIRQRPDLSSPHLPTHELFQLKKTVHSRERQQHDAQARAALRRAMELLNEMNATSAFSLDGGEQSGVSPKCFQCECKVESPCWYCAECDGTCPGSLR